MKKPLSRRDVLKMAQVAGLATFAGGLTLIGKDAHAARQAKGVCRICTMHCGIIATVRGGQLTRVEGDPESETRGFICHHGQALREIVHSPARVARPLRRRGDDFEEVSWEVALGEIAERLNRVKSRHGGRALAVQTGWPFVRHPFIRVLHRFCQAFGTANLSTVASLCEASDRMGKALVVGAKTVPDLRRSKTLVVWGGNPTFSSPPFAHVCSGFAEPGKNLLVVDPIRTELAAQATLHLRVRPGTDGALALGMIEVVVREGLYDKAFVESQTVGFEALARLAQAYPPERVEALTSVPANDVVRAARLIAREGPAAIWDGLGVEHHENGVQTIRAIASLEAICGHVDAPGGSLLLHKHQPGDGGDLLPVLYKMTTPEPVPPPVPDPPIGRSEMPLFHVYNRQAQGMLYARAILEDRPYPLRAMLLFGSNPIVTTPDSGRMAKALAKLELLVTVDPFLSATAAASHYVLPAATFAESPTVDTNDVKVARVGVVTEQHDSWHDWKILFRLARRLGLGAYFPWSNLHDALEAKHVAYMRDDEHEVKSAPRAADAPLPRFPTPSGKIELESELLRRFGQDPLPTWKPPSAQPTAEFPLILVSGPRTRAYINSQFRQIPSIAQKQREPTIELHPDTAKARGLVDGEVVRVISPKGQVLLRLKFADRVHPEAALVPGGWAKANANFLTSDGALDPISGFPAFRSSVCRIERI